VAERQQAAHVHEDAAEAHDRAADLHEKSAVLHEEHATEMEAVGRLESRDYALEVAVKEREAAARESALAKKRRAASAQYDA
jgi:hypothetical protein